MPSISNHQDYWEYSIRAQSEIESEVKDGITRSVIGDLVSRAERGVKKYNTTLEQNNTDDFLQHLYEELLDAAQYVKKEITVRETIQDLVQRYSNDADLGEQIRLRFTPKK